MKSVNVYAIDIVDRIMKSHHTSELSESESALSVFEDFNRINPLTLYDSMSLHDAEVLFQQAQHNVMLVVNDKQQFLGILKKEDLFGERVVQKVAAGWLREELYVSDIMHMRSALRALDYDEVSDASVGDIVAMFQNNSFSHFIVVDHESHVIRGLITKKDLEKRLNIKLQTKVKDDFIDIYQKLHTH